MVKKNREPEASPEASSEHSDSDDSSTSSDEQVIPSTPRPLSPTDDQKKAASESEEESDSPPAPKSKPKAMDSGSKLKTQKCSPKPRPVVLASKAPVKRAVPLDAEESKKKKKKARKEEEEEEGKKSAVLFQRLWGDEDEIDVLKGMVAFKEEKGSDPMADSANFYDFVKNSLQVDVDRKQVVDKIRRLKKRYMNMANKKTLTPHEEKAGVISKLIWGEKSADDVEKIADDVEKKQKTESKKSAADSPVTDKGWQFIGKSCVKLGMDENAVSLGLSMCSDDIKSEIENKWKHLYQEEASFFARKLELACQETKLVLDALKSVAK